MGWLIGWSSKRAVIKHLNNEQFNGEAKVIKSCVRGNTLWQVIELNTGKRFIACNLLGTDDSKMWGYKDMCETMGPGYYSCPLSYLEAVPDPCTEFSTPWRETVRSHHALQKSKSKRFNVFNAGELIRTLNYAKKYTTEVVRSHLIKNENYSDSIIVEAT